jgi:hypothetical protein
MSCLRLKPILSELDFRVHLHSIDKLAHFLYAQIDEFKMGAAQITGVSFKQFKYSNNEMEGIN